MLFSCKISHSLITFLDRRGEDLEAFYERCDWPSEFLRDPSSWLEADKMETLLRQIDKEYGRGPTEEEQLIAAAGHQCKDLRSWGVLDSVLRMVQAPKELFAQPERFLSYFVSPAPPLGEVHRGQNSVSFVLPVSEMQFPYVTSYLRAALEALPSYIAKPMASVSWDNSRVTITWSDHQPSLFGEAQDPDLSLHPELVRNILFNLESSQKQIDELKRTVLEKDQAIADLQSIVAARESSVAKAQSSIKDRPEGSSDNSSNDVIVEPAQPVVASPKTSEKMGEVLHELYRLGDYVARGHQLITLLVGQGRQTRQVEEAMRRVNWDYVSTAGPQLVRWVVQELQSLQEQEKTSPKTGSDRKAEATQIEVRSASQEPARTFRDEKSATLFDRGAVH